MGHGGRVNDGNGGERVGRGEEGSGADPGERRRGRGSERGEWERGPRERGPLAPLSSRGVHRRRGGSAATLPCSDPVGGTGRGRGAGGWAGPGRGCGWRPSLGRGGLGRGSSGGGERAFFLLLSFSVLFSVFSFLFISFSVLFHLKVFRHFIKMCFLHHNYQCII